MSKGVVRVADIKFPLPYKPKSFSLVVVSDALDYLSPKYLNKTVPDLARVASDGLVLLSGNFSEILVSISFDESCLCDHIFISLILIDRVFSIL